MEVQIVRNRFLCTNYSGEEKKKLKHLLGASESASGISFPLEFLVLMHLRKFFEATFSEDVKKFFEKGELKIQLAGAIKQNQLSLKFEDVYEHQKQSIEFAVTFKRVLIADEQGLGKTVTAIKTCEYINSKRVLVVCPGYLKPNWWREVKKFTNKEVIFADGDRKVRTQQIATNATYLIVNYEMLRIDKARGGYPELWSNKWDVVIFDEAHRLKNKDSLYVKGAKKLQMEYCLMLSGTPISGAPQHLWQLLNILNSTQFPSLWSFIEYFCEVVDGFFAKEIVGLKQNKIKELQYILQPLMIRHLKEGLPEKIHKDIYILLTGKHLKAYKDATKFLIQKSTGDYIIESKLEQIIRLQQILANPAVVDGEDVSCINDTILEMLADMEGRVIIGTVFVKAAQLLVEKLKSTKRKVFLITGETKNRDFYVEEFKRIEGSILVGNIAAMAEGLNIDECDTMIFADETWSPHLNEQFENRIHRITSTRCKAYYHLLVDKTISSLKHETLLKKQKTIGSLLDDTTLVEEIFKKL